MNKDSVNEMEQIQKGLEQFLRQEIEGYQDETKSNKEIDLQEYESKKYESEAYESEEYESGEDEESWTEEDMEDYSEEELLYKRYQSRNRTRPDEEDVYDEFSDQEELEKRQYVNKRRNRKLAPSNQTRNQDLLVETSSATNKKHRKPEEPENLRQSPSSSYAKRQNSRAEKEYSAPKAGMVVSEERASGKSNGRRRTGENMSSSKKSKRRVAQPMASRQETLPTKPPKKRRKKSRLKRFLITILVLVVLMGAGLYALVGMVYSNMKYEPITSLVNEPMKEKGVTNILLIGNDSRTQGEDGRSDAMIMLSISNKTNKIYMTSLLRDIYVDIPGYKGNRLNAAYSYGGAELLMETIEQNFDIQVNRYILVNFQAFANLVDAVGGVDLELTNEEVQYVNGYLVEYNILEGRAEGTDYLDTSLSGIIHLNGPQALAYSRNRYLGTDFGRTERQRKVLSSVMRKLPASVVTNPKELFNGLLPNLTTNLTKQECFQLSLQAGKLLTYEVVQNSIPIEGSFKNADIRGMAVLEVDFEQNNKFIRKNIYGIEE